MPEDFELEAVSEDLTDFYIALESYKLNKTSENKFEVQDIGNYLNSSLRFSAKHSLITQNEYEQIMKYLEGLFND